MLRRRSGDGGLVVLSIVLSICLSVWNSSILPASTCKDGLFMIREVVPCWIWVLEADGWHCHKRQLVSDNSMDVTGVLTLECFFYTCEVGER